MQWMDLIPCPAERNDFFRWKFRLSKCVPTSLQMTWGWLLAANFHHWSMWNSTASANVKIGSKTKVPTWLTPCRPRPTSAPSVVGLIRTINMNLLCPSFLCKFQHPPMTSISLDWPPIPSSVEHWPKCQDTDSQPPHARYTASKKTRITLQPQFTTFNANHDVIVVLTCSRWTMRAILALKLWVYENMHPRWLIGAASSSPCPFLASLPHGFVMTSSKTVQAANTNLV